MGIALILFLMGSQLIKPFPFQMMLPAFSTCCDELVDRWENSIGPDGSLVDVWENKFLEFIFFGFYSMT